MARTQISIPREDLQKAKAKAAQLGISLADYIRRLVARDLDEPQRQCDPSVVFNLGSGGKTDIAKEKDKLIGEAFEADYERSKRRS